MMAKPTTINLFRTWNSWEKFFIKPEIFKAEMKSFFAARC